MQAPVGLHCLPFIVQGFNLGTLSYLINTGTELSVRAGGWKACCMEAEQCEQLHLLHDMERCVDMHSRFL